MPTPGRSRQIRGLVADLVHVNFETAPLVEVALGEMAQCLVVADGRELVAHLRESATLAGRVGFIRLDVPPPRRISTRSTCTAGTGCWAGPTNSWKPRPNSRCWPDGCWEKPGSSKICPTRLALAESVGRGLNFVTRAGELVAADGTLYVGPRHTSTGLISRRSELRVLRQQIAEMAAEIEAQQATCSRLGQEIASQDDKTDARGRISRIERATPPRAAARRRGRRTALAARQSMRGRCGRVGRHRRRARADDRGRWPMRGPRLAKVESTLAELEGRISEGAQRANELEQVRQRFSREAGATKIDVVKSEQRLAHLRAQKSHLERDQQERGRSLADSRSQLELCLKRLLQAERDILAAESEVAELYLRKESVAAEAIRHVGQRDSWREKKGQLAADAQRSRGRIRKLEARLHAKELAASEVRHERTTLADRLREDYGIELAELEHEPSAEELQERDEVEREIADLARQAQQHRRRESRRAGRSSRSWKLAMPRCRHSTRTFRRPRASLESIIGKINADSRRLFAETLEVVRGHFQSLFRKLFGGGQADIVLDEGVDILDSGIEIVARPPGKEPRNISLLSGGEKTLTCVAMLLAIFRSRPSPFCVLDEVDAALDEANIERFIAVLQEFLAWTQFIVVTHSKKTMTCASTLYGITMEESGVSKRVSVRFEDVSENGEILNVPAKKRHPRRATRRKRRRAAGRTPLRAGVCFKTVLREGDSPDHGSRCCVPHGALLRDHPLDGARRKSGQSPRVLKPALPNKRRGREADDHEAQRQPAQNDPRRAQRHPRRWPWADGWGP